MTSTSDRSSIIAKTSSHHQRSNMDCSSSRVCDKRPPRRRKTSFTEALKEKYCVEDDPAFDFIIVSPKRKTNSSAELAHLQTIVLNDMDITRADIPRQGLDSLCPNVVDLDLANNLLETWSELLSILSHLPKVRYLNVSRNRLHLDLTNANDSLLNLNLSVENLALNDTGTTIEEVVKLSEIMPTLKELHLCDNNYEDLANIEDSINNGAFSCLECLRLNNNDITRWSEVWKLRHLPYLKCLVLSGNPISNVFYHCGDRTDTSNADVTCPHNRAGEAAQQTSDTDINAAREKCLQCELADSNMDMNTECDGILIDNFDQEDDINEETSDNDNVRSVNRFEFQVESDCSSGSSNDQPLAPSSECDDFIPSNPDARFGLLKNKHAGVTIYNINNSCQGNSQKCLCEGYNGLDLGYLLADDVFDNGNMEGGNIDADGWHRAVAQEFLHEIIEGINFDDISDNTIPQFQPSNFDQMNIASYNLQDVEDGSNSGRISEASVVCCIDSSSTKQLSVGGTSRESSIFEGDGISSIQERSIRLDYNPLSADIEAQFIPRAIRLFDDEIRSSFFYMATPSPPRSRAQRCLFQEPTFNASSIRDEIEDICYRDSSHQSVSDSCSDCEAEQHKHEKLMARVYANAGIIAASADFKPATPSVSPSRSKLQVSGSNTCRITHSKTAALESAGIFPATDTVSAQPIKECTQPRVPVFNCRVCKDEQNLESNNNNSVSEHSGYNQCDHSCLHVGYEPRPLPFQHLQVLCLSSANIHHWNHLEAFTSFPKLTNMRLKNNPLYSAVNPDDRRKLYIASLPKVSVLNGSEVTHMEREKAERHYLRYFMDKEDKPDFYHTLVKRHGPPVKLVDIDLSAGYQEWANLKFMCKGVEEFSRKIHLVEPVGRLRILISQIMRLPKRCFIMYHCSCGPSHPESERELVELRCEALPMSRFDFADGDEIHIDVQD